MASALLCSECKAVVNGKTFRYVVLHSERGNHFQRLCETCDKGEPRRKLAGLGYTDHELWVDGVRPAPAPAPETT